MKKGFFIFVVLFLAANADAFLVKGYYTSKVPGNPYIDGTALQGYQYIADRSCKDISCVQQNIKLIDQEIANLLARRLAFVYRGAQLKNSAIVSQNVQHDPNVITQVIRQAQ